MVARVGTAVVRRIKKFFDENPDEMYSSSQIANSLNMAGSVVKEGLRFLHDFSLIGKTRQNANIFFFSINRYTRSGIHRQKQNEKAKITPEVDIEFEEVDESINQDYQIIEQEELQTPSEEVEQNE